MLKHLPSGLLMWLILILGSIYLFSDSMNTYPAYIHAWTQSDRIALAQNFQLNGFNFFHPATFNLLTKDGITQVDFPIHDYLVACFSHISGNSVLNTFRWYNLIYSLIGLFFFYKLSFLILKSTLRACYLTVFLFTLPFFVYYANGFLPSVPSYANFLIGSYFIFKSLSNGKTGSFATGIIFLSIAALARSTFLIYLFAILIWKIWKGWDSRKLNVKHIAITIAGLLSFFSYYIYNQYLAGKYGSMFLSELLYFKNIDHFLGIISDIVNRWGDQILSPFHGILLASLLILSLRAFYRLDKISFQIISLIRFFFLSLIGVLIFFFAFGHQFAEHDYYYIDTFLPLLSMLLIILSSKIRIPTKWYTPIATLCIIFFFYFFSYANQSQKLRYTPPFNDRVEHAYTVYEQSKTSIKEWGIKKEDTIYVIDANTTNMPFTVWNCRGYTNLNSAEWYLAEELDSNFTYAVIIDSLFRNSTFKDYPEIITRLKRIESNGSLTLYKKSENQDPSYFFDQLIYYGHTDFDAQSNIPDSLYKGAPLINLDEGHNNSLLIESEQLFPFTVRNKLKELKENKMIHILLSADYFQKNNVQIQVISTCGDIYRPEYLINKLRLKNQWEKLLLYFRIPYTEELNNKELSLYFWNPEKDELIVDNIHLLIYQ